MKDAEIFQYLYLLINACLDKGGMLGFLLLRDYNELEALWGSKIFCLMLSV